eukprot:CAMPEP_0119566626 /NCGR_PEP_ID=MMETSP1352-20130426/33621_1 /TAXON_ID=265584 /ORGANISM="Stauroneis constricta, Strain CCMP1120" /LENGTH=311 /DNA_ID=CAMNT_0007615769 /DNA_START=50 /DNA_END=985 /DNA_ORIENTATION=-
MSNNLYGYTDYDGPDLSHYNNTKNKKKKNHVAPMTSASHVQQQDNDNHNNDNNDDDEHNPLQVGLWMEGDSLAPPCGSSISLIHCILEFGNVSKQDVLYDFGAGDGRVCIEAYVQRQCQSCVGIEIELDLIEKGNRMVSELVGVVGCGDNENNENETSNDADNNEETAIAPPRIQLVQADLRVILKVLVRKAAKERKDEAKLEELRGDVGGDSDDEHGDEQYENLPLPTVIVLYLLPEAIKEIEDSLLYLLKKDCRIVCNTWGFASDCIVKPIDMTEVHEKNGASTSLFLYTPECYERLAGFEYMRSVYNS